MENYDEEQEPDAICEECGTPLLVEKDPGTEEYLMTCSNCGSIATVD